MKVTAPLLFQYNSNSSSFLGHEVIAIILQSHAFPWQFSAYDPLILIKKKVQNSYSKIFIALMLSQESVTVFTCGSETWNCLKSSTVICMYVLLSKAHHSRSRDIFFVSSRSAWFNDALGELCWTTIKMMKKPERSTVVFKLLIWRPELKVWIMKLAIVSCVLFAMVLEFADINATTTLTTTATTTSK